MLNCIFCLVMLQSGAVIISRSNISSVINLIMVYIYVASLFITVGAEFMGLLLIIVYVGAISILFLFIIMMLNLRIVEFYSRSVIFVPLILISSFVVILSGQQNYDVFSEYYLISFLCGEVVSQTTSNLHLVGQLLFNYHYYLVILASLVLLLAMVGTIMLTVDFNYRSLEAKSHQTYFFMQTQPAISQGKAKYNPKE